MLSSWNLRIFFAKMEQFWLNLILSDYCCFSKNTQGSSLSRNSQYQRAPFTARHATLPSQMINHHLIISVLGWATHLTGTEYGVTNKNTKNMEELSLSSGAYWMSFFAAKHSSRIWNCSSFNFFFSYFGRAYYHTINSIQQSIMHKIFKDIKTVRNLKIHHSLWLIFQCWVEANMS